VVSPSPSKDNSDIIHQIRSRSLPLISFPTHPELLTPPLDDKQDEKLTASLHASQINLRLTNTVGFNWGMGRDCGLYKLSESVLSL
jgi:hypothetical protein